MINKEELKQRLIELIADYTDSVTARELHSAEYDEYFADYLIAKGVTIRERGEWKDNTFCSRCGYFAEDGEGHIIMSFDDFCPRCGADMRGVKDE